MRIADIFADRAVLRLAGQEVSRLLAEDPALNSEANLELRKEIISLYKKLNNN